MDSLNSEVRAVDKYRFFLSQGRFLEESTMRAMRAISPVPFNGNQIEEAIADDNDIEEEDEEEEFANGVVHEST